MEKLAIIGGKKVRTSPLPTVEDHTGRNFGDEEMKLLEETIRSGKLNYTVGEKVKTLEESFAKQYGVDYCVASSSGTAALHIAAGCVELEPGDEVIVPPITDIGTVIGILYQNAVPVFSDVDYRTFNLDPKQIEKNISERTRAIIPVHLLGNVCDMDPIMKIAEKHNLIVIEDCAQAYFAEYRGKRVGTTGHFGCFSMQQSKHITAGDGGLTITNDKNLAEKAKLFSDKGWQRPVYCDWLFLAPNYRMTELQAAVGLAQLGKVDAMVGKRISTGKLLKNMLEGIPGVLNSSVLPDTKHTFWQFGFLLDRSRINIPVDTFGEALDAEGIPCLPGYTKAPMYLYPLFQNKKTYGKSGFPFNSPYVRKGLKYESGICSVAEKVINDIVVLPWSENYTEADVHDIGRAIKKVAEHYVNEA